MTILKIITYPDPRLYKIARPVDEIKKRHQDLIKSMAHTMYESNGIGLAATQVDFHERIIVIDISEEKNNLLVLINPDILERTGSQEYQEGCLSVPKVFEKVERFEKIRVKALDQNGKYFEFKADGLLSVCIQHEIDHLDGKVFVDYLSSLKRNRIKTKLIKAKKRN
tara:strand:+ start:2853 stop:3353 length:501 start_codon:yes stop_codon:yes gene_type:complete